MDTLVGAMEPQEPEFNYEAAAATYRAEHEVQLTTVATALTSAGRLLGRN